MERDQRGARAAKVAKQSPLLAAPVARGARDAANDARNISSLLFDDDTPDPLLDSALGRRIPPLHHQQSNRTRNSGTSVRTERSAHKALSQLSHTPATPVTPPSSHQQHRRAASSKPLHPAPRTKTHPGGSGRPLVTVDARRRRQPAYVNELEHAYQVLIKQRARLEAELEDMRLRFDMELEEQRRAMEVLATASNDERMERFLSEVRKLEYERTCLQSEKMVMQTEMDELKVAAKTFDHQLAAAQAEIKELRATASAQQRELMSADKAFKGLQQRLHQAEHTAIEAKEAQQRATAEVARARSHYEEKTATFENERDMFLTWKEKAEAHIQDEKAALAVDKRQQELMFQEIKRREMLQTAPADSFTQEPTTLVQKGSREAQDINSSEQRLDGFEDHNTTKEERELHDQPDTESQGSGVLESRFAATDLVRKAEQLSEAAFDIVSKYHRVQYLLQTAPRPLSENLLQELGELREEHTHLRLVFEATQTAYEEALRSLPEKFTRTPLAAFPLIPDEDVFAALLCESQKGQPAMIKGNVANSQAKAPEATSDKVPPPVAVESKEQSHPSSKHGSPRESGDVVGGDNMMRTMDSGHDLSKMQPLQALPSTPLAKSAFAPPLKDLRLGVSFGEYDMVRDISPIGKQGMYAGRNPTRSIESKSAVLSPLADSVNTSNPSLRSGALTRKNRTKRVPLKNEQSAATATTAAENELKQEDADPTNHCSVPHRDPGNSDTDRANGKDNAADANSNGDGDGDGDGKDMIKRLQNIASSPLQPSYAQFEQKAEGKSTMSDEETLRDSSTKPANFSSSSVAEQDTELTPFGTRSLGISTTKAEAKAVFASEPVFASESPISSRYRELHQHTSPSNHHSRSRMWEEMERDVARLQRDISVSLERSSLFTTLSPRSASSATHRSSSREDSFSYIEQPRRNLPSSSSTASAMADQGHTTAGLSAGGKTGRVPIHTDETVDPLDVTALSSLDASRISTASTVVRKCEDPMPTSKSTSNAAQPITSTPSRRAHGNSIDSLGPASPRQHSASPPRSARSSHSADATVTSPNRSFQDSIVNLTRDIDDVAAHAKQISQKAQELVVLASPNRR